MVAGAIGNGGDGDGNHSAAGFFGMNLVEVALSLVIWYSDKQGGGVKSSRCRNAVYTSQEK